MSAAFCDSLRGRRRRQGRRAGDQGDSQGRLLRLGGNTWVLFGVWRPPTRSYVFDHDIVVQADGTSAAAVLPEGRARLYAGLVDGAGSVQERYPYDSAPAGTFLAAPRRPVN